MSSITYLKWPFSKENNLAAKGAAGLNVGTKNIGLLASPWCWCKSSARLNDTNELMAAIVLNKIIFLSISLHGGITVDFSGTRFFHGNSVHFEKNWPCNIISEWALFIFIISVWNFCEQQVFLKQKNVSLKVLMSIHKYTFKSIWQINFRRSKEHFLSSSSSAFSLLTILSDHGQHHNIHLPKDIFGTRLVIVVFCHHFT